MRRRKHLPHPLIPRRKTPKRNNRKFKMEIKFILESLLFSAQRPMSVRELREVFVNAASDENADETAKPFKKIKEDDLTAALEELARDHEAAARSYRLACVAGAWQFVTQPEFSPWLKAL